MKWVRSWTQEFIIMKSQLLRSQSAFYQDFNLYRWAFILTKKSSSGRIAYASIFFVYLEEFHLSWEWWPGLGPGWHLLYKRNPYADTKILSIQFQFCAVLLHPNNAYTSHLRITLFTYVSVYDICVSVRKRVDGKTCLNLMEIHKQGQQMHIARAFSQKNSIRSPPFMYINHRK